GTAIKAYSGSNTSARNSMMISGQALNDSGTQMWGAVSQLRQLHSASNAKGQVGQRNQGRSRSRLSTTSGCGSPKDWLFHNHQCCAQKGAAMLSGIHHARPMLTAMAADSNSQPRRGHKAPCGWKAKTDARIMGRPPIHPRVKKAAPRATPKVMAPATGRSIVRATAKKARA